MSEPHILFSHTGDKQSEEIKKLLEENNIEFTTIYKDSDSTMRISYDLPFQGSARGYTEVKSAINAYLKQWKTLFPAKVEA